MRKSPLRIAKYLIGFSIVFAAVSNCFNAISSSSSVTVSPLEASRIEQPNRDQHNLRTTWSVSPNRDAKLLESSRPAALSAGLAGKSLAFAPGATPFAPSVTATKSHTPSGSSQPGDTLTYTVVITNSGTSDATGVNFSDTIDPNTTLVPGSVIASPIAVNDSYHTIGNVNIQVPVGQGVIANDFNPNGSGTLTVTQVNSTPVPGGGSATASTANGSVTMSSDGSFTYNPNVAFRGPSDSFTYTLGNGTGKTDTATVTVAVNGLIWFVNVAAAPGGDGRLSSPFNCLVGPGCFDPVAADIANDNIFVYTGAYVGGLTLLNGQKLIGQGAGDTLLNITGLTAPSGTNLLPATGGTPPVIAAAGPNITLGSGNTIRGLTLNGTAPAAVDLSGSGFGTVSIAETALGGIGQALNLSSGTLTGPVASTAAFTSISSTNSSTTGISLTSVAGSMSSGSTSVANPTGIGISVNTSSAALNFGNTSSTLSGGTGVSLTSNTGTITFGTLSITPDANQRGLLATNNTMTITTAGGAITTTGAVAVEITRSSSTTPLAMSFTSVSANGGANAIVLTNTSGSFTIAGDGTNTNNGSGGTIQNCTATGLSLSNVSNLSLSSMSIHNNAHGAILGTSVNAFSLLGCSVATNGAAADDGIKLTDTSGAVTFTNDTVTASGNTNVQLTASASSTAAISTLTVTNGSYNNSSTNAGFLVDLRSTASIATASFSGVTFSGNFSKGLQLQTNNNSVIGNSVGTVPTGTATVTGCTFTNNNVAASFESGGGTGGTGSVYYRFVNNTTITGSQSHAVNFANGSDSAGGTYKAFVSGNVVGNGGIPNSGSAFGDGIRVFLQGQQGATVTILNNTIRQCPFGRGIDVSELGRPGNNFGQTPLDIKITGNDVNPQDTSGFPLYAIYVGADAQGTGTSGSNVHAEIHGNTVPSSPSACDTQCNPDTGMIVYETVAGASGTTTGTLFNFSGVGVTVSSEIANTNTGTAGQTCSYVNGGSLTLTSGPPMTVNSRRPEMTTQSSSTTPGSSAGDDVGTESTGTSDILRVTRGDWPKDDLVRKLTQSELVWIIQAAIYRWSNTGIAAEDLARLQSVTFEITALRDGQLASTASSHIKIDETAAGYGWYLDQSPYEDSEFDVPVLDKERQTSDVSIARGRMDLLTVIIRQLGTVYLQGKNKVPKKLRWLMESTLSPAVRRMPEFNVSDRSTSRIKPARAQSLNATVSATVPSPSRNAVPAPVPAVFNPSTDLMQGSYGRSARRMSYAASERRVAAFAAAPVSGETVTLNIGTIPAGKSVTIMFQVTINNPLPNGVCSVTNVGHVTGSNFSPVDTNSDVTPVTKPVTIGACPANITKNTDPGVCTAVVNYTTPTGDGCPVPTVTCNPASGSAFAKGTTTVTCTASNGNPPDATCSFTVTVNDNQPPTITCPANITQSTDANQCSAVVTYANATATDNCPGVGTPVCTPASGATFAKGTTTVNCTVSDASGNPANCAFTATVNDTQAPTITCPANVTKSTDPSVCTAVVTYPNATATDNCSGVGTPACTPASGSTFAKGTTTVNCTVSDASGNPASCSFTVTVKDTQAPTMSPCPSNISVVSSGGCQVVNYPTPTATDNCGSATVTCSPPSGTCFPSGTTTVTCTASDTSPDSPDSSCSFTVTVVPCAITCPNNITKDNDPGQCGAVVTFAPTTSGGGCGTVTCTPSSGSFFPVGTTTVTCNTQAGPSCSFTVTVRDAEAPVITPTSGTIELWPPNHNYTTITMSQLVASATDNCDGNVFSNVVIASVSSDEAENAPGDTDGNTTNDIVIAADCKSVQLRAERDTNLNGRVYTIVLRVRDAAGNVGNASRTVIVPLDQSGGGAILGPGPGYTVTSGCP